MENIALEVFDLEGNGSQFANLPPNTSITVTETSEIFDSGDIWSHSFVLNVFANASIFGTTGDIHGGRLHEQIDSRRARLWVLGLPMYYGYLKLDDEVDVEENGDVSVSFESGRKTFIDMVDGVKANQVPIPDDILIGMAVDRERTVNFENASIIIDSPQIVQKFEHPLQFNDCTIKGIKNFAQMYPKFVQPYGEWTKKGSEETLSISRSDTVNTDYPYDAGHPYCNTRICYQRKEWKMNNGNLEKQATREYKLCPGGRVNPSPNFYLLYWVDMLMKHLNIHIDENQMLGVEDLKRLFFVNTKCAYKTGDNGIYTSVDQSTGYDRYMPFGPANPFVPLNSQDDPSWELKGAITEENKKSRGRQEIISVAKIGNSFPFADPEVTWQPAYATSDNFPNVDIKDVIEAIEAGFGIRMLFSSDYTRVRIVLLRNIFRSSQRQTMPGTTIEEYKTENRIRGFRLTYGGSKDDTEFVYKGFELAKKKADGGWLTEEGTHDYSQFDRTLHYDDIKNEVRMLNNTCYIDEATGNSYIIKVDKDARNSADQYNPSLFGCADFMDAEDGDCTGEENTIKEIRIGFTPMIANIMGDGTYAIYVNEDMSVPFDYEGRGSIKSYTRSLDLLDKDWESFLSSAKKDVQSQTGLFEIATATSVEILNEDGSNSFYIDLNMPGGRGSVMSYTIVISGWICEGYRLYLEDNYEPNDDMECPLEKHDWGLMFGIMRGTNAGSVDATVTYENDIDDGEGNCTWELTEGSVFTAHSDICNDNGEIWDYRPMVAASGKDYGDYVINDAGGIPVNMRGNTKDSRKGPVRSTIYEPYQGSGYSLYDLYAGELFSITEQGYFACDDSVTCKDGKTYAIWINCVDSSNTLLPPAYIFPYIEYLKYGHVLEIGETGDPNDYPENLSALLGRDAMGCSITAYFVTKTLQNMIVFATQKAVSYTVLQDACEAYNHWSDMDYTIPSGEEVEQTGLISLKLRAEKPNPYYDPSQPEEIIRTKEEAGAAMQRIFTTSDTDLLDRPLVSNVTMRSAGWDAQGDGYATVYSIGCGVEYSDGKIHEILWTPIKENGTVLTKAQLDSYVNAFNKKTREYIIANDTDHLILDIDTTNERADLLHRLQAIYYASAGEIVASVSINPRYLDITTPALRHRGLADQFHAEESYWWRNARIIHKKRCMGIADIMNIDKTVQQKVDGVTGFVKKLQYSVDIQTGLSPVEMEIMYL